MSTLLSELVTVIKIEQVIVLVLILADKKIVERAHSRVLATSSASSQNGGRGMSLFEEAVVHRLWIGIAIGDR